MPESEVQIHVDHPYFSKKQLESIKRGGEEIGTWYKTPKPLRSPLFWEAVKAAMILSSRGFKEQEMLLYSKRDESGILHAASLIYQGKAVYPIVIENTEEIKKLGLVRDVPFSAALRQHASRAKRRDIRRLRQRR